MPKTSLFNLLLSCWLVLLASPLLFLIRAVRKKIVLRVAVLVIAGASYLVPLIMMVVIIGSLNDLGKPGREFVINQDQTLAGVWFPKGSKVTTLVSDGRLSSIVLSEDIEINGIPAGKGTTVLFSNDGKSVDVITTGRAWSYREIAVPKGSTIFQDARGIRSINLGREGAVIQGTLFLGTVLFRPRMADGSQASWGVELSRDTMVHGIPCKGSHPVAFSIDERTMECYLAQPFDSGGYKLKAWRLIRVLYEKGINGEKQGKAVMGTLREDSVLSGVTWPDGVTFQKLGGAAETGASFRYEVPSAVVLPVEDMLIQGPSTLEFDGDKLRSVHGHYVWHGEHYKSYQVNADGQMQREPD
jgi:hypothetical protein